MTGPDPVHGVSIFGSEPNGSRGFALGLAVSKWRGGGDCKAEARSQCWLKLGRLSVLLKRTVYYIMYFEVCANL